MRQSLRFKLILVFQLMALIPLTVMGLLYFDTLYKTLLTSAERELQVGAQQTALWLDTFFNETIVNLRSQAQLPIFSSFLTRSKEYRQISEPALSILFKALGRTTNQAYIQSYMLIDRQGEVVYDQTRLNTHQNVAKEAFFRQTIQSGEARIIVTEPDESEARFIYFAVPVWSEGGEAVGVLALRYNLSVVQLLAWESVNLAGQGSFPIVADEAGRVLSWKREVIPSLKQIDLHLLQDTPTIRRTQLAGWTYAVAHQRLQGAPLHVLYVQPEADIETYIVSHISMVLLISAGILATTLLVALWVANRFFHPIQRLTEAARQLMNGDLSARVQVTSDDDEIGLLARTFNQMAAGLQEELQEVRAAEERYRQLSLSLEQMVEQRTEQLQKANQELESFSYSVSHDLRAPLRAINGFSAILEESATLDEEARRHLAYIRAEASRMGQLIDGLLALSRVGRHTLRIQTVTSEQLTDLVNESIENLRSSEPHRLVEWKIGSLPGCAADPTLLRQVFINLLNNAFKYSRERSPAVIEIGFQDGAYFIRDNGTGFDMRYADRLFGVFQRLHTGDRYEGTGIGLATVRRIIERHGGRIWAQAEPGQGAQFWFTLPPDISTFEQLS
ncbi:MAG: ATP-binding protein [Anaerolineales bacterium]|nr:ATP-binding protein [Anaerolineales bacterium]MDW8276785.1 ATP-binding protein [Anaerolineales bacterium]